MKIPLPVGDGIVIGWLCSKPPMTHGIFLKWAADVGKLSVICKNLKFPTKQIVTNLFKDLPFQGKKFEPVKDKITHFSSDYGLRIIEAVPSHLVVGMKQHRV